MPAGAQLAQSVHAGIEFAREYPDLLDDETTLVCVTVADEVTLTLGLANYCDPPLITFREPTFGDALTAAALIAGPRARRWLRSLPLALRGGD